MGKRFLGGNDMRIGEINQSNYTEFTKLFIKNNNTNWPASKSTTQSPKKSDDEINENMVNQFGLKGMSLHYRDDNGQKIIAVSDDIREKMNNLARREFVDNYGMSDGEEKSSLVGKYLASVPENERCYAAWTIDQIYLNEAQRLTDYVKETIPGWQHGKAFDRNILTDVLSNGSIDKRV